MDNCAKTKRFRVALSFPGEHRSRVEEIAEALARRLGREKVLYDKWHAAEFARPNLDVYLPRLYHGESDLIVIFLSERYNEKEWCGLEGRAWRDVLKHKENERLMLLRLDDAEVPGIYSIDGHLDIRDMADGDVAAAILNRLGETTKETYRAFTSKLPFVNPTLIGREEGIAFLDRAWADTGTNVVQVIAAGGTGKTALVDKWFRRHHGEATVFGWSFYSQGSSVDRQTSSDPFFTDIIKWFGIGVAATDSIYIKAEAIARRLREERTLLLLDGVEPLQEPNGTLRDMALRALLQELATGHLGLVVCTTRIRMNIPEAMPLDLDNLTPEQGAEYLRSLNVAGPEEELRTASREYGNHALALTLLGTFLADFYDHDIYRRFEISGFMVEDSHARRVIAAYERMFAGQPELDMLRALGYFDRPAEPAALKLVLPAMDDRQYRTALRRLYDARLILTTDPTRPIDCHPLIREHFAAEATSENHARLYEYYKEQAPRKPNTLEEMTPLFYAVYHGCQAGRHQSVCDDVYFARILRKDEFYLTVKLGAFGTDLSLLANFFDAPWIRPGPALSTASQASVFEQVGYVLGALGRFGDAEGPLRAATESYVGSENWEFAARSYGHLSIHKSKLGDLHEAVSAARQATAYADRSGVWFQRLLSRTKLALALHLSGDSADAIRIFAEAEHIQAEGEPRCPILYGVHGYRYCDLLLDQGQTEEVLRRASQALQWEEGRLQQIGLDHLLIGRAHPVGSAEAVRHLDQAVDFLRRAGHLESLPYGLLGRGTEHDLEEVLRIASRTGMRLFLADYHLASARLAFAGGESARARAHIEKAKTLVRETGYHRRDRDIDQIDGELGA